jgi:hypothetical protein
MNEVILHQYVDAQISFFWLAHKHFNNAEPPKMLHYVGQLDRTQIMTHTHIYTPGQS